MIQSLHDRLHGTLARFHRDEGGAIALLCMASIMILFMVGLLIYDSGEVARDKIDAQMAADTGAYSQVSVRARAMNTIAFANIGKRTVTGIHNMYSFQYPMYMSWLAGQCSRCCCGWFCGCWTACRNCIGNWISLVPITAGIKYIRYLIGMIGGGSKIIRNLRDLDAYQSSMRRYAGFWAMGEGLTRSLRNGSDMVGTYPHPNTRSFKNELPLTTGRKTEVCLAPSGPVFGNPSTVVTLLEWVMNFEEHKRLSKSKPNIASKGPREVANIAYSYMGCAFMLLVGPSQMRPWYNQASGDDGRSLMRKSNMMFTYRYNPDIANKLNDNYNYMAKQTVDRRGFYMGYKSQGGTWGMSRGEFIFPPRNKPSTILAGDNDMWMFHPGWIGKLRPVVLPNEQIPVKFEDMFKANRGSTEGGSRLLYTSGPRGLNFNALGTDLFMDVLLNGNKAFKSMDSQSKHGNSDRKYLYDGLHK